MNATTQTRGRNLRATIAVVLAAGLVGVLALVLMSAGGTADNDDRALNAPGQSQGEGFPHGNDKFAPGRIIATAAPETELQASDPSRCSGEGLMDPANYAYLQDAVGSVADYCTGGARYAGGPETEAGPDNGGSRVCQDGKLAPGLHEILTAMDIEELTEYCASNAQPAGEPDTDGGPGGGAQPLCQDGKLSPGLYEYLPDREIEVLTEHCASNAHPAGGPDAGAGPGEGFAPACRDGRLAPEAFANLSDEAIYFQSRYCASNAYPAGEQDGASLAPTGEGWLTSGKPD